MTLSELREEIWEHIGEPSDIDPSSSPTTLTDVCNWAQNEIASWKDSRGIIHRIDSFYGTMFWKSALVSGTLGSAGTTSTIVLPSGDVGDQDDRYNEWVVENTTNGESRLIVDYTGASYTATVHKDWDTAPASSDEYKLYKRFSYLMDPSHVWVGDHISLPTATTTTEGKGNLIEILKVIDLEAGEDLTYADEFDDFEDNITSPSDPKEFYRIGNKLYFDRPIDEEKWFKMEYWRLPTPMANDSDEPEIPEHLHWGIVLWGIMWGHSREGESSDKYSAKRDFIDFMDRKVSMWDVKRFRHADHGTLLRE